MPGLNGFDACREIRLLSPQAGIVMVTVKDFEEDKVRALEAGADDYVTSRSGWRATHRAPPCGPEENAASRE